jgi:hypothetical protein
VRHGVLVVAVQVGVHRLRAYRAFFHNIFILVLTKTTCPWQPQQENHQMLSEYLEQ